jgi:hypothetical protein
VIVLLQEGVLRACLEDGDSWLPLEALLEDVEGLHCMDTSLDEHDGGQVRQTQRQKGQGGWGGGGRRGRGRERPAQKRTPVYLWSDCFYFTAFSSNLSVTNAPFSLPVCVCGVVE